MTAGRLPLRERAALFARIWYWYLRVRLRLRHGNLVEVVTWLGRMDEPRPQRIPPARLGRMVGRALPLRLSRATCLQKSLVLFRLLARSGIDVELVIGLPRAPKNHDAHAWTEVNGIDIGPPPGSGGYAVLARYRSGAPPSPG